MDTTEQSSVVGQITPTEREGHIDRYLVEVVITVVFVLHTPGITTDNTVNTLNGVDNGSSSLTPETAPTHVTIVKDSVAQAVCHFTKRYTTTRRGDNVVDSRRFCLTQKLPHGRTQ